MISPLTDSFVALESFAGAVVLAYWEVVALCDADRGSVVMADEAEADETEADGAAEDEADIEDEADMEDEADIEDEADLDGAADGVRLADSEAAPELLAGATLPGQCWPMQLV